MQLFKLSFWQTTGPGLLAATCLAVVAATIGDRISWLGGAGMGILAGVVLATSFAFDAESVPTATLVKMTRTVMVVPMALIFSFVVARRNRAAAGNFSFAKVFPWFVLGFLLMSAWTTWGGMPAAWAGFFKAAGKFLIVVALSGIGLNTSLTKLLATGVKPIILGACLWFVVAALALAMIR